MSIPPWLQQGMAAHRQGDLVQAERCYRQLLRIQPKHPDATHLLGVLALQRGNSREAEKLISKAIRLNPKVVDYHNNLGEALRQQRRWSAARNAYRAALRIAPTHCQAHNNLGLTQGELGLVAEAETSFRAALKLQPDYFEAHFNLAQLLIRQGLDGKAAPHLQAALSLNPRYAPVLLALGNLYRRECDYEQAISCYDQLLALNSRDAVALANRGECELQLARYDAAMASLQQAIKLNPRLSVVHNSLGVVLNELEQPEQALSHFEQALALEPESTQAALNRAQTLREQGQHEVALPRYDALIKAHPELAEAYFGRAMIHLAAGRWDQGWADYEWRFATPFQASLQAPVSPRWSGESQGRLLLLAEQGFGDQLMAWRYLAPALERVDELIVQAPPPLARLIARYSDRVTVVDVDAHPEHDAHLPLLSLPHVLDGMSPAFAAEGYLNTTEGDAAFWTAWLDNRSTVTNGLRVGLCWSGSVINPKNRKRQLGLQPLQPLFELAGIEWVCLQKEISEADRQWLHTHQTSLLNPMAEVDDFADTAALIARLDLVITLDSAVAHLAGAMGRPCWTLVPFYHDWRWQLVGEKSVWYDSMQLFRQPSPQSGWVSVIEQLALQLKGQAQQVG